MTEERMALVELVQKAGEGDFLRAVAEAVLQILMEADVKGLVGAARHERSPDRLNYRNGYRDRILDTRLGALQLQGELYPRIGFIVTNLTRPNKRAVKFCNGCGTAEQHIKEGKTAIRWTRLSCNAFRHNAVRLQLHALAYNLANFLRSLALPDDVAHWSLRGAGQDRRPDRAPRPLRGVPAGRGGTAAPCLPRSCAGSTGSGPRRPPLLA